MALTVVNEDIVINYQYFVATEIDGLGRVEIPMRVLEAIEDPKEENRFLLKVKIQGIEHIIDYPEQWNKLEIVTYDYWR